jgi:hypothetical protein
MAILKANLRDANGGGAAALIVEAKEGEIVIRETNRVLASLCLVDGQYLLNDMTEPFEMEEVEAVEPEWEAV